MSAEEKYTLDMNDPRAVSVKNEFNNMKTDSNKMFDDMVAEAEGDYKDQVSELKGWATKQAQLQQDKTNQTIKEINQQKDQAKKDYTKEQSGAYVDWQKQSNQYGANAEQMAAQGMTNTGYAESSQVSMYNTYQNRIMTARESFERAKLNYDNAIAQAKLQNSSILAEIAYNAYKEQLELSIAHTQYKNTLLQQKVAASREIEKDAQAAYMDVLDAIYKEDALNAEIAQQEANRKQQKEIADAQLKEEQRQFDILHPSGGTVKGGSGNSGNSGGSGNKSTAGGNGQYRGGGAKIETKDTKETKGEDKKTSEPTPDMSSVLSLGRGPISAKTLDKLVASGQVLEYEKNGKLMYKNVFKR